MMAAAAFKLVLQIYLRQQVDVCIVLQKVERALNVAIFGRQMQRSQFVIKLKIWINAILKVKY
jgi:hypothetical protein